MIWSSNGRTENNFGCPIAENRSDSPEALENFKKRKFQYIAADKEGRDVFLADSAYVLQMAQNDFKEIRFHFRSEY